MDRKICRFLALGVAIGFTRAAAALAGSTPLIEAPALPADSIPEALAGQTLRPLSLASADFDGDGVPDLAAGFATDSGGAIVLYRGNVDAIYPNSPEARQRRAEGTFVGTPFLPTGRVLELPAPPDFLLAGDFDADGNADLVVAQSGSAAIELLAGDGRGGFRAAERIALPGPVTVVAAGEIDRRDGLADLAVAIGGESPALIVFQDARGAWRATPERSPLPAEANAIAIGDLDGDAFVDVAIAAAGELLTFSGRGSGVRPPMRAVSLASPAGTLAIGVRHSIWYLTPAGDLERLDPMEMGGTISWKGAEREGSDEDPPLRSFPVFRASQALGADEAAAALAMRVAPDSPSGLVVLKKSGALSVLAAQPASTFTVNTNTDTNDVNPGDGVCSDSAFQCSLRAAIQEANAHPGADVIHFAIPGTGIPTIVSTGILDVTEAVTIDGTTQPAGRVEITGAAGVTGWATSLNGGNSVIRGLVINQFGNGGIRIASDGNVVEGNYIGTNAAGTSTQGSIAIGDVWLVSGSNNTIGGTTAAARNLIAGGGSSGVYLAGGSATLVAGNYIGTDVTGTVHLANAAQGIYVSPASTNNTVGGPAAGAGNLISGNAAEGVRLDSSGNVVEGNRIGTNAVGSAALGNGGDGVLLYFVADNTVGAAVPGGGNLVSANASHGIEIRANIPTNTAIEGNLIGTNAAGTAALGNGGHGVAIFGGSNNTIGGTTAAARNVISGNALDGVDVAFGLTNPTANLVVGNYIGTDATGTARLGNAGSGVELNLAAGNTIGGAAPGSANVISGNQQHGVVYGSGQNAVLGNLIGTDVSGTAPLGNSLSGIYFPGNLGADSQIGGTGPGEANAIAFNGGPGVSSGFAQIHLFPNRIFGNGGLGIDLHGDGVTPNQAGRSDDFPIVVSALPSGGATMVTGMLDSAPNATFDIYLFSSTTCDPSGYGEGESFVGSTTATTDANGHGSFSTNVTPPIAAGRGVAAYAKAPGGSPYYDATSEFSPCRTSPFAAIVTSISPTSGPAGGGTGITVSGGGFQNGATLSLGGVPATGVSVTGGTQISATTPTLAPGTLNDVKVTNPDTTTASLTKGWFADFSDVPETDLFHSFVEKVFRNGITSGCGGGNYCRNNALTRAQMAVFLLKAEHGSSYLPPACTGVFPDVPCPSPFADWIERLFQEGITGGCGGGRYCPNNPVTRQQMAVFLMKTKHGASYSPPACTGIFGDVACPSTFANWIEELYNENVTGGCQTSPPLFCPTGSNTRGQMAVFLVKTFNLQ